MDGLAYHNLVVQTVLSFWALFFASLMFRRYRQTNARFLVDLTGGAIAFTLYYTFFNLLILLTPTFPSVISLPAVYFLNQLFWYFAIGFFLCAPAEYVKLPFDKSVWYTFVFCLMAYLLTTDVLGFSPREVLASGLISNINGYEAVPTLKFLLGKGVIIVTTIGILWTMRNHLTGLSQRILAIGLITFAVFGFTSYRPDVFHYYFFNAGTILAFAIMSYSFQMHLKRK